MFLPHGVLVQASVLCKVIIVKLNCLDVVTKLVTVLITMGKQKQKNLSAAAIIAQKTKQPYSKGKNKQVPKRNRWKKGHSCESNPSTRKHREKVSSVSLFHNKGTRMYNKIS